MTYTFHYVSILQINKIMIIYYLYIKTHNKTGLQYLGQTTQNPVIYRGSGDRWINHINKHGYDVTTRIIQKCYTKTALKEWGLFYSRLWSVVDSKKWANLKPEEGNGFASGEFNPMKNTVIARKHSVSINSIDAKYKQKQGMIDSWKDDTARANRISAMKDNAVKLFGKDNRQYDKTVYTFIHTSGIVEYSTQQEFRIKHNLVQQSVSNLVKGITKIHRGWQVQ